MKFSSDIYVLPIKAKMTEESQATAGGLNLLIKTKWREMQSISS